MPPSPRRPLVLSLAAVLAAGVLTAVPAGAASAAAPAADCPPAGTALGFSDALDKLQAKGAEVGGLSALARDARRDAWVAVDDHSTGQPARLWFVHDLVHPRVTGTLLLRAPDGTPYTDQDFDAEGLAVLPDGTYAVSSEVEPSVRLFGRDGVERGRLPVPPRFRVAPAGQATENATLEGLSVAPDGRTLYAAMEGVLSGDTSADPDGTARRILVYTRDHHGWRLAKQVGYRVDVGMRISEVAATGGGGLLVMEAAYDPATGNTIRLEDVRDVRHARDVRSVADLSTHPAAVTPKTLVADVTACPDLGATAKEPQANPLMDNYEAMAVDGTGRRPRVILLSDDNFSPTQTTRVLRLRVTLPQ